MQETKIFSVVKIELTPNPRSMKFILDGTVLDAGSKTISEGGFLEVDSFAHNMFALDIVDMVYLRENFVSVTLTSADLWLIFKDKIKNIGAYYILTNAAHPEVKNIFQKDDVFFEVSRASTIGGTGSKRGKYAELIMTNGV